MTEKAESMTHRAIARITSSWEKLASRSPALTELYSLPYRTVVQREIALAGISRGETILHVGCGAVPFTAIHAVRLAGVRAVALDCDPDAVRAARACTGRLDLNQTIEVILSNAAVDVPGDFDAAIVALQAEPKEQILRNLLTAGPPDVRVVFRAPSPHFSRQYDPLPRSPAPDGVIPQEMKTFNRSILYCAAGAEKGWC